MEFLLVLYKFVYYYNINNTNNTNNNTNYNTNLGQNQWRATDSLSFPETFGHSATI